MRIFKQRAFQDCGFSCLAMIASHYGRRVSPEALAILLSHEDWMIGMSLAQLQNVASHIGLKAKAVRCSRRNLAVVGLPGIAHCVENHFVVVERITPRGIRVLDPRHGVLELTLREFDEIYSGIYMIFSPVASLSSELIKATESYRSFLQRDGWIVETRKAFARQARRVALWSLPYCLFLVSGITLLLLLIYRRSDQIWLWVVGSGLIISARSIQAICGDAFLFACYERLAYKISHGFSGANKRLFDDLHGYRVEERFKWLLETLYNQLHTVRAGLQVVVTLGMTALIALFYRSWEETIIITATGATAWLELSLRRDGDRSCDSRFRQRQILERSLGERLSNDRPSNRKNQSDVSRNRPFMKRLSFANLFEELLAGSQFAMLAFSAWRFLVEGGVISAITLASLITTTCWCLTVRANLWDWAVLRICWQHLLFMRFRKILSNSEMANETRRPVSGKSGAILATYL